MYFLIRLYYRRISACKAKHCATFDDSMEGFNPKKVKKKKGRQEGLFDTKVKR